VLNVFGVSLLLTLALEGLFAYVWGLRRRRELAVVALVNILTNPPVVLLYYTFAAFSGWNPLLVKAVLELTAVAVEWFYYRTCSEDLKRPFLFALLANAFSYGVGCIINAL